MAAAGGGTWAGLVFEKLIAGSFMEVPVRGGPIWVRVEEGRRKKIIQEC